MSCHRCVVHGGCALRHRVMCAAEEPSRRTQGRRRSAAAARPWGVELDATDGVKCEGAEKRVALLEAAQPGGLAWGG